jgi:hypothetical protein
MVPEAAEPEPPVDFRLLLGETPLAGTSESVFVVEPGLLALDDGVCAEAAVTPNRSAAAAIAVMAFIKFPLSSEKSDGFNAAFAFINVQRRETFRRNSCSTRAAFFYVKETGAMPAEFRICTRVPDSFLW